MYVLEKKNEIEQQCNHLGRLSKVIIIYPRSVWEPSVTVQTHRTIKFLKNKRNSHVNQIDLSTRDYNKLIFFFILYNNFEGKNEYPLYITKIKITSEFRRTKLFSSKIDHRKLINSLICKTSIEKPVHWICLKQKFIEYF